MNIKLSELHKQQTVNKMKVTDKKRKLLPLSMVIMVIWYAFQTIINTMIIKGQIDIKFTCQFRKVSYHGRHRHYKSTPPAKNSLCSIKIQYNDRNEQPKKQLCVTRQSLNFQLKSHKCCVALLRKKHHTFYSFAGTKSQKFPILQDPNIQITPKKGTESSQ